MTPSQTTLYWRLWKAACERQGWKSVKGRITLDEAHMTKEGRNVVAVAEELAYSNHRAVTMDDLRHGVHKEAFGFECSSKEINRTTQFDQVKAFLQLLADENSLRAARALTDPSLAERSRLVRAIKATAPEAYILHIARNRKSWGLNGEFWEDLPNWALIQLLITVKERAKAQGGRLHS